VSSSAAGKFLARAGKIPQGLKPGAFIGLLRHD
jgi:hypothetical protein